jgi:hypothetical protein
LLSTPLTITRSTGAVLLSGDLTVNKTAATIKSFAPVGTATLQVQSSYGQSDLFVDGAHGYTRSMKIRTGASLRWLVGANNTVESGSNSGTDFVIAAYSDTGTGLVTPISITRSNGAISLGGDLTVSKASAVLRTTATSGTGSTDVSAVDGSIAALRLLTGSTLRWDIRKNATADSGGSSGYTGANLEIYGYDNSGSSSYRTVAIERATGNVTFDYTSVHAAGLRLASSSGPFIRSGTGSPEGVVTAPVGSMWTDTAATTGAIRWIKASGTGNTGWVVEYGDTGNRNLAAEALSNGWTVDNATFRLRRVGSTVTITLHLFGPAASGAAVYTLPSGFRPPAIYLTVTPYGVSADSTRVVELTSGGAVSVYNYGAAYTHYWSATWQTTDAWPSSLPGTAA